MILAKTSSIFPGPPNGSSDAVHAESATAALAKLDGGQDIKLLFTDVVMPGINGKAF